MTQSTTPHRPSREARDRTSRDVECPPSLARVRGVGPGHYRVFVGSILAGGINALDANSNPNEQKIESQQAYDVFNAGGTADPYEQSSWWSAGGPGATSDPAFKATVAGLVDALAAAQGTVGGVATKDLRSAGRSVHGATCGRTRLCRWLDRSDHRPHQRRRHSCRALLVPIRPIVDAARAAHPGTTFNIIDATFINEDINSLISEGLDSSLVLTIPLTFIILPSPSEPWSRPCADGPGDHVPARRVGVLGLYSRRSVP